MYNTETKERLNQSKSIVIDDHVWVGQNVFILKGSKVGSGSIIGARSIVPGKRLVSNALYAGTPVRKLRDKVFFPRDSVHSYRTNQ